MDSRVEAICRFNRFLLDYPDRGMGTAAGTAEAPSRHEIHGLAPESAETLSKTQVDDRDRRLREGLARSLRQLDALGQQDLLSSLSRAHFLLAPERPAKLVLRAPGPGEVSLIAARQAALYAQSHGWGARLECLIAETAARFLRQFEPDREACWVADLDGVMAGAVFLTDEGEDVARLRLLHVEPFARRRGIGDALVRQCLSFARERGYRRVILWTHTVLETARRLYARNGFSCVSTAEHDLFGVSLQGEDWACELAHEPYRS